MYMVPPAELEMPSFLRPQGMALADTRAEALSAQESWRTQ